MLEEVLLELVFTERLHKSSVKKKKGHEKFNQDK